MTADEKRDVTGCGDNSCIVAKPSGMATNGGCQCSEMVLRRAVLELRARLTALEAQLVNALGKAESRAQAARAANNINADLRVQLARKDEALREIANDAACRCDDAYTGRGRCEPNALCYLADIARSALGEGVGK